jgi:hypothetical protein
MQKQIIISTLIDISDSAYTSPNLSNNPAYHQRQNLHVFLQCISLRAQPMDIRVRNIRNSELDDPFTDIPDNCPAWELVFSYENDSAWRNFDDSVHWLKIDIFGVPISSDLGITQQVFDFISEINTKILHM